jgi:hypothetical protein
MHLIVQRSSNGSKAIFKHPDAGHHGLQQGERAVAVKNVKAALAWLGLARVFGKEPDLFDDQLTDAVRRFQERVKSQNIDGIVGPGTRSQLVSALLRKFGASKFSELDASQVVRVLTVFLSYARVDTPRVDKLDQWLRDHGVRVIRDL